ncbi:MAG: hypothetical protein WBQ75_17190 [Acetobacteraceae bacterium]
MTLYAVFADSRDGPPGKNRHAATPCYSPISSRQFDDTQVLSLRLFVEDPTVAFNPVDMVPDGTQLLRIIAGYKHRASKLRCGKPHCGVMHNKGFVVQLEDGSHALIGHVCGKALFGTKWEEYEGEHLELRERQRLLTRKRAFLDAYPQVVVPLRTWRFAAEKVQAVRRSFNEAMPKLAESLRTKAGRSEVALTVSVQIDRGFAAASQVDGIRSSRQLRERAELVHTLQGAEFFGVTPPRQLVEKGLEGLERAAGALAGDNLSNHAMRRGLRMMTSALGEFRHAERLYAAAQAALREDDLAGITTWAMRQGGFDGEYKARGRSIVFSPRGGRPRLFEAPHLPVLDAAPLTRLEEQPEYLF